MSLEIIVNEGNKLGFLRVWRDHWAGGSQSRAQGYDEERRL
jgi:hypothetical protein